MPTGKATSLLLVVCGVMLLSGCEATRYSKLPEPTPVSYDRQNLIKVMEDLDARRLSVKTMVARLDVTLFDHVNNKQYALRGAYIGDCNGNMRLKILRGDTTLLDLAYRGETVDVWLPRRERFFRGQREEVLKAKGGELALLAQAGNAHDLFFPRCWTDKAIERRVRVENGREIVSVLERPDLFIRKRVRRFQISREQPFCELQEVFTNRGGLVGTIHYADFRTPGPLAGEEGSQPNSVPYPGHVTLTSGEKERSLQLKVEEMILNAPVPLTKYEVGVPEDVKIRDLSEALKSEKGIFE